MKERDIAHAFELGIRPFAVDCVEEADKIARAAPGSRVFCRVLTDGAGAEIAPALPGLALYRLRSSSMALSESSVWARPRVSYSKLVTPKFHAASKRCRARMPPISHLHSERYHPRRAGRPESLAAFLQRLRRKCACPYCLSSDRFSC